MGKLAFLLLCSTLAACQMPWTVTRTGTQVIQVPTPEAAIPADIRPGGYRLMAIEKLYVWCATNELPLRVDASANSH